MSVSELQRWALYLQQEPTNSIDIHLAQIAQILAIQGGVKNKKLDDFLITGYKPKKEPVSNKAILEVFKGIAKLKENS